MNMNVCEMSVRAVLAWPLLLLLLCGAARVGPSCPAGFREGRADFVVNAEDSVADGATLLSSTTVHGGQDCQSACCGISRCNLALVERAEGDDSVKSCVLFDCVYRNRFVCKFVKKSGFSSYIRESVYERYLQGPTRASDKGDRLPTANAGPDVVIRPGESVKLNGIESSGEHNITSYKWVLFSGNSSVVSQTAEFPDQLLVSNLRAGLYEFQLTVTDSEGQTDTDTVRILVLTHEQSERHCLTPKKVGPCRGSFPRWFYNAASNSCEEFTFGGCVPNENNFISQRECDEACDGTTVTPGGRKLTSLVEVCGSPCGAGQFQCSSDCCVEEELHCDGQTQCTDGSDESDCGQLNRTLSRLLEIQVNEEKARCVDPPVTGPCRASLTRFYYDPLNRNCHRFTFGGCGGNKNNFEKKDSCMDVCRDVTDSEVFAKGLFERSEQEEHQSGSVATAVIIAVVVLVLLALLGYCLIKKKRSEVQHQRAPVSSPAVALNEETENLVYKPTTTTTS
ncbi:kunitz-type protease inhibitor 1-like [Hoplias malabaricus]|uniref:kunitz-type protease inhibitor 1-like n=1 Tax=Hoplias malabaricus TaxID=27720 RepID=UPI0034625050